MQKKQPHRSPANGDQCGWKIMHKNPAAHEKSTKKTGRFHAPRPRPDQEPALSTQENARQNMQIQFYRYISPKDSANSDFYLVGFGLVCKRRYVLKFFNNPEPVDSFSIIRLNIISVFYICKSFFVIKQIFHFYKSFQDWYFFDNAL